MKLRSITSIFITLFLCANLTLTQAVFAQEGNLTQDEVQIILIQFKLYETFVQGNLQQYMTLWASDAEFRVFGSVTKGKQDIETLASGLMQSKPQSIQNRLILTIKGETATVSTLTLYAGSPTATPYEMDIVYRYVKEGGQWLIQVEDTDVPHAVELLDADFDKGFREDFYPAFQKSIEALDQVQMENFTTKDVKVISK